LLSPRIFFNMPSMLSPHLSKRTFSQAYNNKEP